MPTIDATTSARHETRLLYAQLVIEPEGFDAKAARRRAAAHVECDAYRLEDLVATGAAAPSGPRVQRHATGAADRDANREGDQLTALRVEGAGVIGGGVHVCGIG